LLSVGYVLMHQCGVQASVGAEFVDADELVLLFGQFLFYPVNYHASVAFTFACYALDILRVYYSPCEEHFHLRF